MSLCAVPDCFALASWSPWWELWLCFDHLEAVDWGAGWQFPEFDLDPDEPAAEQIVALLKGLVPA